MDPLGTASLLFLASDREQMPSGSSFAIGIMLELQGCTESENTRLYENSNRYTNFLTFPRNQISWYVKGGS
jgi:hypothetical protein